ncbi:hypothetical protein [Williamsia serinedens]
MRRSRYANYPDDYDFTEIVEDRELDRWNPDAADRREERRIYGDDR